MTLLERYCELYEHTDPNDPVVADDVQRGIRWSWGETDIHHHLPRLRALAKGNVLEIGVRYGSSTVALLLGVVEKGGHVWSVDTNDCRKYVHSSVASNAAWTFIQASSSDAGLNDVLPMSFDFLFIDGDHTYDGVLADLMNFGPRSCVIALHDANRSNPDVLHAIGKYLSSRVRHRKLVCYRDSAGLAVIL